MKRMETPRLILRGFEMSDLPAFFRYARKPNIGPSAGWRPHDSIDESLMILKKFVEGSTVWAITLKSDGRLVGSIGLDEDRHRRNPASRSIGFVLDDEYWGQGLMVEAARRIIRHAFEELELELVSATHYPFNSRSKRVIEKCGLVYEAALMQATRRYDGEILDEMLYIMTKEHYKQLHQTFY